MNNKKGKGVIGITLAVIMIASIFAVIAPTGADDVVKPMNPARFDLGKDTTPDPVAKYKVGDTIDYEITAHNPSTAYTAYIDIVEDIYPDGSTATLATNQVFGPGDTKYYPTSYTVTGTEATVIADNEVINYVHVHGYLDVDGVEDLIDSTMGKTSSIVEFPEFDFSFEYICCRNFEFTGTSSYVTSPITDHKWAFGDGETTGDISGRPEDYDPVEHQYDDSYAGSEVTVTLSGHNDMGQYGEYSDSVYIPEDPKAVANANKTKVEADAGEVVTFDCDDSGVDTNAPPEYGLTPSYHWEFDDEQTGSSDDECVTTRVVDGEDGDVICGTLTVNDTHCNATDEKCVRVWAPSECKLRVYGRLNEGAGDPNVYDPETCLHPENPPYAYDPEAPFYPQAQQAPRKDFVTFDPIIMYHNDPNGWLNTGKDNVYKANIKNAGADASEKIFKRMWYEPTEWYKDENSDGKLDLVLADGGRIHAENLNVDDVIKPYNSNGQLGDIYAPSIKQEFTYMMLDSEGCPEPTFVPTGIPHSSMMIPAASWESSYTGSPNGDNGLDSFDVDGDDEPDRVLIESEYSLCMDIDNDGRGDYNPDCMEAGYLERLDEDGNELSGDETLVLTTDEITLGLPGTGYSDTLQFFDHKIVLKDVFGEPNPLAKIRVYYQGETSPPGVLTTREISMGTDDTRYFSMGFENTGATPQGPFFVTIIGAPSGDEDKVTVKVGRMFGNTWANVGANPYWNQKHFYVDSVCYNVVAIKTDEHEYFKYITFRQKLPKIGIKINQHTQWLKGWDEKEILPEMPQFNMNHAIVQDVQTEWTIPDGVCDKMGMKQDVPALEIEYNLETTDPRFHGELKELYYEDGDDEGWMIEHFQTIPYEYTLFRLPPEEEGGLYLVTSAFWAPESFNVLWDGGDVNEEPIDPWFGKRLKFWYEDCSGPYFVDYNNGSLRVYGYLDQGAGDLDLDVEIQPENPPYTDPMAPFLPQAEQAPEKDFVTFNPILMYHNDDDWDNNGAKDDVYKTSIRNNYGDASEKIFKRMWYEPTEWYKDELHFGEFDLLLSDGSTITASELKENPEALLNLYLSGVTIVPYNDDEKKADLYAPSIKQEFTYMMLDSEGCPQPAFAPTGGGSSMLIPMATWESGNGLDSFDADGFDGIRPEGTPDRVLIESEASLGFDIDGDGIETLSDDGYELSSDETLVLTLDEKTLSRPDATPRYPNTLKFFDHKLVLTDVLGTKAKFDVYYQGETTPLPPRSVEIGINERRFFCQGQDNTGKIPQGPFFVEVTNLDPEEDKATVKVGRMFGETWANIGWMHETGQMAWGFQKQFYVDGVCYNVVAIKTDDYENFKYITFRQKLPKVPIKIEQHSVLLKGWDEEDILPEMPQFNMRHTILEDIQPDWTIPDYVCDKLGPALEAPALEITYVHEDPEPRFKGELKEIYHEYETEGGEIEGWMIEWFQTIPYQYTGFELPTGHGRWPYLVTSAFYAHESYYDFHDGEPICIEDVEERLKYWFNPGDMTDIYVNKPPKTVELDIWDFYDLYENGGNENGKTEFQEVEYAWDDFVWGFGEGRYPFGPEAMYYPEDLLDLILKHIQDYRR